jgi:polar amino acid transport system substrate-binding protein
MGTAVGHRGSLKQRWGRVAWIGLAALLAAGVPRSASPQTAPPLRLVSTAWPPFTNPPGEPRFALDLVNEALKRIHVAANTTIVDESRFIPSVIATDFDGSAALWKDPEREKLLLFSEPFLENRLILVGRRGSDVSATSMAALAGKRVVLVGNYSYGAQARDDAGPVFLRSRNEEDSLAKLLVNEADYTLMDDLVVQYIMSNYPDQARDRLQFGSAPLIVRPLYFAIRRTWPNAAGIIQAFNAEVRKMIVDRTYLQLLHLDWIEADIDGDGKPELISRTDQIGLTPPEHPYDLSFKVPLATSIATTSSQTAAAANQAEAKAAPAERRVYLGGHVYENWASVPEHYKSSSMQPDFDRSTASLFRFAW